MELLAPVGNAENLIAAVAGGADAVYLGLTAFNARARAENFSLDELTEAVKFAHLHGVKVHVAMNTLLKNSEIPQAIECLKAIENSRADAIIIADLGILELARDYAPSPQYHASTQMGAHNREGAAFLKRLGFNRIVLARETTKADIKDIKENVEIELEYFVHGALCVSLSGNCYMSALAGGNSGNRGRCLQFCRKQYVLSLSGKKSYALSLKDNCMIGRLGELKELGIDSLKIEGRLKSKSYVYSVTSAYRRALDGGKLSNRDIYALNVTFNRGAFTEGYVYGDDKSIIYPNIQSNIGYRACKIVSAEKVGENYLLRVDDNSKLKDGLGVKIIVNDSEIAGFKLKMQDGKIIADKPYRGYIHITSDSSLESGVKADKLGFDLCFTAEIGKKAAIFAKYRDIEIQIISDYVVDAALTAPNKREEIVKQLSKFGDTEFSPKISLNVDSGAYLPNRILADMRRELADKLTREILDRYKLPTKAIAAPIQLSYKSEKTGRIIAEINGDNARALTGIESPEDITVVSKLSDYFKIRHNVTNYGVIYLKLPVFASKNTINQLKTQINQMLANGDKLGIYADNYYALELAHEFSMPVIAGFLLNIANDLAVKALCSENFAAAIELNKEEIPYNGIVYSYGNFPVMSLLHCPVKNVYKCDCGDCKYREFQYSNDFGNFAVTRERNSECVFTVHNTACHNLLSLNVAHKYVDLTLSENPYEALSAAIKNAEYRVDNATKGAYYRRVK